MFLLFYVAEEVMNENIGASAVFHGAFETLPDAAQAIAEITVEVYKEFLADNDLDPETTTDQMLKDLDLEPPKIHQLEERGPHKWAAHLEEVLQSGDFMIVETVSFGRNPVQLI